jgi:hypothetical protein
MEVNGECIANASWKNDTGTRMELASHDSTRFWALSSME